MEKVLLESQSDPDSIFVPTKFQPEKEIPGDTSGGKSHKDKGVQGTNFDYPKEYLHIGDL
jgi:hypothetical protein